MATRQTPTLLELFRETPAKSALLTVGPLALAVGQLLNGYLNGVSPLIAVGFAVAMIGFAVVATRHHAAEHRLARLEATLEREVGLEETV
ncbi:hypothetical protein [Natronobiforma cellulositropha]|uniref:hypothetical protein n=1 Tax=Natronobiforma cellulositropha TaxID=1679076 RepID=UPI0021D5701A|nr:hypothetical protein [Natronobiforma cellulositropha]